MYVYMYICIHVYMYTYVYIYVHSMEYNGSYRIIFKGCQSGPLKPKDNIICEYMDPVGMDQGWAVLRTRPNVQTNPNFAGGHGLLACPHTAHKHICTYIHVCRFIYTYMYLHIHMCICIHIYMYMCTHCVQLHRTAKASAQLSWSHYAFSRAHSHIERLGRSESRPYTRSQSPDPEVEPRPNLRGLSDHSRSLRSYLQSSDI